MNYPEHNRPDLAEDDGIVIPDNPPAPPPGIPEDIPPEMPSFTPPPSN